MGSFSLIHWIILGLFLLLLFGGNRFSSMMNDVAKGLKSFKQGMSDEENKPAAPPAAQIPAQSAVQPTPHPQQATLNGETVVDANESVR
jgi:sec-independent protein translocase protein TatA